MRLNEYIGTNSIIIDELETWPIEVTKLLESNRELIANYFEYDNMLDRNKLEKKNKNYFLMYNIFEDDLKCLISSMRNILCKKNFIGFHCSRLFEEEIEEIVKNGLLPLNNKMCNKKIGYLRAKDKIKQVNLCKLIDESQLHEPIRSNKIYTFHALKSLRKDDNLLNFMKIWGGEAFYIEHENKPEFIELFSNLGMGVILVTKHAYIDFLKFDIERKMLNYFYNDFDDELVFDGDNVHINKVSVVFKISETDEIFKQCINYESWNNWI